MTDTVFTNVRVLDCSGAVAFDGEVRIQGNRIHQVLRDGARASRDGADVVDGSGATLVSYNMYDLVAIAELSDVPGGIVLFIGQTAQRMHCFVCEKSKELIKKVHAPTPCGARSLAYCQDVAGVPLMVHIPSVAPLGLC